MPQLFSQNALFDMHDRLAGAQDDAARWAMAQGLLARIGADWVTAGTAPATALHAVAVATSVPGGLMADYMSERIYEIDPWIAHASTSSAIDAVNLDTPASGQLVSGDHRLVAILSGYGVRQVTLVPVWTGARTGAVVLYATCAQSAARLRKRQMQASTRQIIDTVAAWFRPERMAADHPKTHAIRPLLTQRETEALKWVSRGLRTAEIAWKMGVEDVTVSKHFASARKKLSARTREQAVAIAIRDGLIQL